ncbi:helix-turn-helix domain-containing protein [Novosphingobium sp. 1748]|uniref:helix-turn-helix domain-containing protein n=2 Tax=Novosphingobium TaxID=165696 RepID=UPI002699E738|nr:helix-turn-helix domain-containing protein [Novosphingobium sp. 1748]
MPDESSSASPPSGDLSDSFAAEVAQMRKTIAAGRSVLQLRLFDYLAERSGDVRAPKEIEVALAVFGVDGVQDSAADSGVRVYVHRLRKRLDDHYRGHTGQRLIIPKGEYRIALAMPDKQEPIPQQPPPAPPPPIIKQTRPWWPIPAAAGLGVAFLTAWAFWPVPAQQDAQDRPSVLSRGLDAGTPPTILVGDAYVLAETGDRKTVRRMILDPAINSREDLGQHIRTHPEEFYRLFDFDLHFTPVASTQAAWTILQALPNLGENPHRRPIVLAASKLKPAMLQAGNVVYVGRLANLGPLSATVGGATQFRLTAKDTMTDPASGQVFRASPALASEHALRTDYGYLANLPGPTGRGLLISAGMGDFATDQMGSIATSPTSLDQISARIGRKRHFEALYEFQFRDGMLIDSRLVAAHGLR